MYTHAIKWFEDKDFFFQFKNVYGKRNLFASIKFFYKD